MHQSDLVEYGQWEACKCVNKFVRVSSFSFEDALFLYHFNSHNSAIRFGISPIIAHGSNGTKSSFANCKKEIMPYRLE